MTVIQIVCYFKAELGHKECKNLLVGLKCHLNSRHISVRYPDLSAFQETIIRTVPIFGAKLKLELFAFFVVTNFFIAQLCCVCLMLQLICKNIYCFYLSGCIKIRIDP